MVYINADRTKAWRVGDRFAVMRPDRDPLEVPWFKWQEKLLKAMGTVYLDAGQVRVVNVQPKVAVAEVIFSCGYMQRGDILRPFVDRPSPPFKDAATFDHFAPVSGKPVAMLVAGLDYSQLYGAGTTVYVNLGAAQNVKVATISASSATRALSRDARTPRISNTSCMDSAPRRPSTPGRIFPGSPGRRHSPQRQPQFLHRAAHFSSSAIYAGDYVELE